MLCNLHCRPHWLAVGLTVYPKEFYRRGLFVWKHLLLLGAYSTTYRKPGSRSLVHHSAPEMAFFSHYGSWSQATWRGSKHKHVSRALYQIQWHPESTCHTMMGQDIAWGFKVHLLKHAICRLCHCIISSQRIDLLFSSLNIFFGSNNTILDLSGFLKILQRFLCGS